jgi:hypothetical protein
MTNAVAIGVTTPQDKAADRTLATLRPIADRCAAARWTLWLRAWPAGQASDAWVLLAALLEKAPRLRAGVVASFPAATRVSDVEDLLVVDNLSGGRLDLAFAPDAAPEAMAEVVLALRGEALSRRDAERVERSFVLTPGPARGVIGTWLPLVPAPPSTRMAWRLQSDESQQALLVGADAPRPGDGRAVRIVDLGPRPSLDAVESLMRAEGRS